MYCETFATFRVCLTVCGIAGIIDISAAAEQLAERVAAMQATLKHRGPDDAGDYLCPDTGSVMLGHQRLAIIDPEHGAQPMTTADGMITIVFNGAIYNYLELRRELIGLQHPIHSYSDTEVLLYAYRQWGEACLTKLQGMFAFAIWDRHKRKLFCARDRLGIKPFYFARTENFFVFASEIKAILASNYLTASADFQSLQDYVTFQYTLGDKTLFNQVYKLEPGCMLTVSLDDERLNVAHKQYWDLDYTIDDHHNESYFIDHLAFLLEDSVRQHLRSDVALGAHLSGGLDSSTVVCMATSMLAGAEFKTFTGAFHEGPAYDETHYAKLVAQSVNANYQEIYIPSEEFANILPKLIYMMDEPAAGPGLIPQYFVSKLAAEHVKVVLGGQGGDELYIGYARYLVAYLEKCLHGAIFATANQQKYAVSLDSVIPHLPLLQNYVPMLQHSWREGLFTNEDERYFRLINRSENSQHLYSPEIFTGYSSFAQYQQIFNKADLHSLINRMTYFDLKASLPALLQVEDRTSMAVSLESRVPLLDHRIVEFLATVPPNIKFAQGQSKYLFRQAIKNVIPEPVLSRQDKMGFPMPIQQWFKDCARDFVMEILFSNRARQRGIYNIQAIEQMYQQEHQYSRIIWGVLCLELWHRIYIDGDGF